MHQHTFIQKLLLLPFERYLKSKTVIRNLEVKLDNLSTGVNARLCVQRGIEAVEQSILIKGWIETSSMFVTVDPACETRFRESLPHYRIKEALVHLPSDHHARDVDEDKVAWLLSDCLFHLVDGHHRVLALLNLRTKNVADLPERVR